MRPAGRHLPIPALDQRAMTIGNFSLFPTTACLNDNAKYFSINCTLSSMNTAWITMYGFSTQKMSFDHYLPQFITRFLAVQIVKYTLLTKNSFCYLFLTCSTSLKTSWARPGFEPGTSHTRSKNHTPRPTSHDRIQLFHLTNDSLLK